MVTVVKIGGNVVDNPQALEAFLRDFASMPGLKVLVHGGGKEATRLAKALDIPTTMIDGRRVTDRATLDVVAMVYAGLINKRIVSMLQSMGCDAIGLSGADGNAIRATRRNPEPIDFGYVGDIAPSGVNDELFSALFAQGLTPVVCAIMHDGKGNLLNCNADSVASAVAIGLSQVRPTMLVYCFEKPGVLADVDDDNSLVALITPDNYADLREGGAISGGMIPKIDTALKAVASGVASVVIKSAENLKKDRGTTIKNV